MIRTPKLERPADAFVNRHEERVRFGDTDAAGIVYYATYYRYFEAGRAELMRAAGLPYRRLVEDGLFLPVVECWCRYRASAQYDDLLIVTSWVHEIRSSSLLIGTEITREETCIAHGGARLGCVTTEGRIRRLPPILREMVIGEKS